MFSQYYYRFCFVLQSLEKPAIDLRVLAALTAVFFLLTWRIWKFFILPQARPQSPKVLPYWIPCVFELPSFRVVCFKADIRVKDFGLLCPIFLWRP